MGWHRMVSQPAHWTTVCAWLKTVVLEIATGATRIAEQSSSRHTRRRIITPHKDMANPAALHADQHDWSMEPQQARRALSQNQKNKPPVCASLLRDRTSPPCAQQY